MKPVRVLCANERCQHFLKITSIPLRLVASFRISEKKSLAPEITKASGIRCRHCGTIHVFAPLTVPLETLIV